MNSAEWLRQFPQCPGSLVERLCAKERLREAAWHLYRTSRHRWLLHIVAAGAVTACPHAGDMGDKEAARKSYQEFSSLWKDADAETPIYKEAKTEYAKLQ